MRTVVIYASKYGTTKKCAEILGKENSYEIFNVKNFSDSEFKNYDNIILGTSLYMFKPRKEFTKFCKKNEDVLKSKNLYIYTCGLLKDDKVKEIMKKNVSEEIMKMTKDFKHLGGESHLDKAKGFSKLIYKKLKDNDSEQKYIDEKLIIDYAKELNEKIK